VNPFEALTPIGSRPDAGQSMAMWAPDAMAVPALPATMVYFTGRPGATGSGVSVIEATYRS